MLGRGGGRCWKTRTRDMPVTDAQAGQERAPGGSVPARRRRGKVGPQPWAGLALGARDPGLAGRLHTGLGCPATGLSGFSA